MTFYANRQKFDGLSEKIGKSLSRLGISPNQWTAISILPTLLSFWFIINREFMLAAVSFILAAFLDMVDGAVARATGKTSRMGAYIDTMMDRYVEFIVVLGLVVLSINGGMPDMFLPATVWIFIFYFGSIMTSYAKAAAKEKDFVKNEIKGGLVERAERLIMLFIGIVFASISPVFLTLTVAILAVLTNITVLQRVAIANKSSG